MGLHDDTFWPYKVYIMISLNINIIYYIIGFNPQSGAITYVLTWILWMTVSIKNLTKNVQQKCHIIDGLSE